MVQTVTIFESFVKVADTLKEADQGKFYRAIMHYALYGEIPELESPLDAYFGLIKPIIDKSNSRKMAGKKGGEKGKQTESKTEANCKQKEEQAESKMQANNKQTDEQNGSDKGIGIGIGDSNKSVCVSGGRACAYASDAERIARAYPQGKTGVFRDLLAVVMAAIEREMDLPGATMQTAIAKVEQGTMAYANAMHGAPKRYLAKPEDFYSEGRYSYDPSVWDRTAAARPGNNSTDSVLHKNTAFAANERGLDKMKEEKKCWLCGGRGEIPSHDDRPDRICTACNGTGKGDN